MNKSSIILLTVSFLALIAGPLAIREMVTRQDEPVQTRPVSLPIVELKPVNLDPGNLGLDVPSQTVITAAEVVISGPKAKAFHAFPKKDKVWTCGAVRESQDGGFYRPCEWI